MASRLPRSSRSRARGRRFTPLELAIGFALVGSVLAIAVPTFVREVHASRLVEPVDGLQRLGTAAVSYARSRPVTSAFPSSAPLTPPVPPRGHCEPDEQNTWDHPTWRALDFRAAPQGTPHCFSFSFDSADGDARSTFRAQAHGDLDGDGAQSTFEITGHAADGDPAGPAVDRGMYVESEVE